MEEKLLGALQREPGEIFNFASRIYVSDHDCTNTA